MLENTLQNYNLSLVTLVLSESNQNIDNYLNRNVGAK